MNIQKIKNELDWFDELEWLDPMQFIEHSWQEPCETQGIKY